MEKSQTNNKNNEDNSTIKHIELVDIEDIVPNGGNSLFLSLGRVLIYMSFDNPNFERALEEFCGILKSDLKNDLNLQFKLRKKLCDYICENAFVLNRETNKIQLRKDFQKWFNNNVYDFLIQLYQLSINNFCNNTLFRRFAISSFSKILNINICYRKSSGKWKLHEPGTDKIDKSKLTENKLELLNYLLESTIYLQEYQFNSTKVSLNENENQTKSIRLLLNKKLWLSKCYDNYKVCMKFSQFNDADELSLYEEPKSCIGVKKLLKLAHQANEKIEDDSFKIFCVFLNSLPIELLISCENSTGIINSSNLNKNSIDNLIKDKPFSELKEMEFSNDFNTIGKQFFKFEQKGIDRLIKYLNHVSNKKFDYSYDTIMQKYNSLIIKS